MEAPFQPRPFSHVAGFDDAPFSRQHRGDVPVIGTVFAGSQLTGVLSTRVRKDGVNSTAKLTEVISGCRFREHLQLVMLQGIALGGFNVVDIGLLNSALGLPVLVVARHRPDLDAIRAALLGKVRGGKRKWALIEKAGPMERTGNVFIQRAGLSFQEAMKVIQATATCGHIPEPLRAAHLIAGGVFEGESRGRA